MLSALSHSLKIESVTISRGLYMAARYLLACVFIYAGATKLAAPRDFAIVIEGYGLLPDQLVGLTAILLPALEVLAGLALLLDIRASLGAITAMTIGFLAVLGYGIALGLDVDCGCYGPGDPEGEAFHDLRSAFMRDLGLLAVIIYTYWWRFANHHTPRALSLRPGKIFH